MQIPDQLETHRLFLRVPVQQDAEVIFERYAQDPEVTRFLKWTPHKSVAETRAFLERCAKGRAEARDFAWVITQKPDAELAGMIGMHCDGPKAMIGYVLAKPLWRNGYATEAASAVVQCGLAQKEIWRVWAFCDVENPASRRVLEKVGMQCEGILKRWSVHPTIGNEPRDCYCYASVK